MGRDSFQDLKRDWDPQSLTVLSVPNLVPNNRITKFTGNTSNSKQNIPSDTMSKKKLREGSHQFYKTQANSMTGKKSRDLSQTNKFAGTIRSEDHLTVFSQVKDGKQITMHQRPQTSHIYKSSQQIPLQETGVTKVSNFLTSANHTTQKLYKKDK